LNPKSADEEIQIHHRLPRSLGGNNSYSNLVLVHLLCHQQIHAKAKRVMDECQKDNDREVLTDESSTTRQSKLKEKKKPRCS
jgi:5-methylcytosine-specific restriction endonuclease McrA